MPLVVLILHFSLSGVAFGSFDGNLSCRLEEEYRMFRLLDYASTGSPGHGPIHLLVDSAQEIGFNRASEQAGWIRPGLPPLRMMTGPIQHFLSAIWQAWQHKVAADLCKRKGFRGALCFDIYGSHQLLACLLWFLVKQGQKRGHHMQVLSCT